MIVSVIGPPNSGKSLVGEALGAMLPDAHWFSGGEVARTFAARFAQVQAALNRGDFVPPEIMDRAMVNRIHEERERYRHVVVDGYPRYFEQLLDLALMDGPQNLAVVVLMADPDTLERRNLERGRSDTHAHQDRMRFYRERTQPMVDWIENRRRGIFIHNVNRTLDSITSEILTYISEQVTGGVYSSGDRRRPAVRPR